MPEPNAAQRSDWNGESGLQWVADANRRDAVLQPVLDELLQVVAVEEDARVLDVGCGCGVTTMAVAERLTTGSAVGIDISRPMLDVARERARDVEGVSFVEADAQAYAFEAVFDLVVSRFGTMFFDDPTTAFTNLHRAVRPGGRLCIATWQPLAANEWLSVPTAVLARHTDLPKSDDPGPGMFAQADPGAVIAMLSAAGWHDPTVEERRVEFTLGSDPDDAVDYLAGTGLVRRALQTIASDQHSAILDELTEVLGNYVNDAVRLGAGINIVCAAA